MKTLLPPSSFPGGIPGHPSPETPGSVDGPAEREATLRQDMRVHVQVGSSSFTHSGGGVHSPTVDAAAGRRA